MSMSKKDFVGLADVLKRWQGTPDLSNDVLWDIADFCERANPDFKRGRWLDYIAGKCGPGGKDLTAKAGR